MPEVDWVTPFTVADQVVPVLSPPAVKVTGKSTAENATGTLYADPVTVTLPLEGVAVQPESEPTL